MQAAAGKKHQQREEKQEKSKSVAWLLYNELLDDAEEVQLDELECWAMERMKVLQCIDWMNKTGSHLSSLHEKARNKCNEMNLPSFIYDSRNKLEDVHKDRVSHFVLRLAFCSQSNHEWFLENERHLFEARFHNLRPSEKEEVMRACGISCYKHEPTAALKSSDTPSHEELKALLQVLKISPYDGVISERARTDGEFYYMDFTYVPQLLSKHRCLLKYGLAYVHESDITTLIGAEFRKRLYQSLVNTQRKWHEFARKEADRMKPIVESLPMRYLSNESNTDDQLLSERIKAADVTKLAQTSFPLCMKRLVEQLTERDHLKHGGRMQLGLFLKGIGLPLEESLAFWRHHFTKRGRMTVERWEKEHAYNIRHNYGMEGSRISYSPPSCSKIISEKPGPEEFHGCPYATLDEQQLRGMLASLNLSSEKVSEVVQKAKEDPKVACTRTLAFAHGKDMQAVQPVEHPKTYFKESQRMRIQQSNAGSDGMGHSEEHANNEEMEAD